MKPRVTVVTVVYNGAATLERTILSVLGQSCNGVEYIIVDGGSTDGTLDIIRKYERELAYWISEKDAGIYDAMNKGIGLASGEWVGMINADDAYEHDTVSKVLQAVDGKPRINIVHGDILIEYPNGNVKVKRAKCSGFLLKYWEMVLNHPTFFVRRSYYGDHPFNASFRVGGDHLWTYSAWRESPSQFLYLPTVLARFAAGGASMRIPLRKVLSESDAMATTLGFTAWEKCMARSVRTALYLPAMGKLWFNQLVGSKTGDS